MIKKRVDIEHILVHAAFQAVAGIFYGFAAFMLIRRGFSATDAGLCISFSGILNFILQPTISNFVDKSKKQTAFSVCVFLSAIMSVLFFINFLLDKASLVLAIVFIIMGGVYSAHEPLINSIAFSFMRKGLNIEFGAARAVGSICYGIVCALFGTLADLYSFKIVTLFGFIFAVCQLIIVIFIKKDYDSLETVVSQEKEETINMKEFILNHKSFMVLCVCLIGLFFGYTIVDNFMLLICENVGGGSSDMGNILAFKAILEGIAIFIFSKLKNKFNIRTLLKIAAFFFACKNAAVFLSNSVLALYLSQLFQMISFALMFPAMVEFVNQIMSRKEAVRGQACFTMTITVGSIASSACAGIIADTYSVSAMCGFGLIVEIISALGFILIVNKAK